MQPLHGESLKGCLSLPDVARKADKTLSESGRCIVSCPGVYSRTHNSVSEIVKYLLAAFGLKYGSGFRWRQGLAERVCKVVNIFSQGGIRYSKLVGDTLKVFLGSTYIEDSALHFIEPAARYTHNLRECP